MASMLPTVKYKVIGTGVTGDPFRCEIPIYNFVLEVTAPPNAVWEIQIPPTFVNSNGILKNGKIRKQYRYTKRELNKLPEAAQADLLKWKSFDYEANEVP